MNPNLQADMFNLSDAADYSAFGQLLTSFLDSTPNVRKVEMHLVAMTMGKPCFQVTVYMEQYIEGYANSHGGWNPKTQKYDDAENGEAAFMHNASTPVEALEACITQYKSLQ